jgi:hypothetical protein
MSAIELPILAIVVAWLVTGWPAPPHRREVLQRIAALAVAAWIAEQSMIRAHGYYFYPPGLSLQIGHVPLVVVLAWPVVLECSWSVARRVTRDTWARVITTGILVGCFAGVWQPLAMHLHLVRWNAGGPFGVPPIGMLGAAIFGGAMARLVLDTRSETPVAALADVLAAVGATHVGVLACWHAGLWRLEHPVEPPATILAATILAATIVAATIVGGRAAAIVLRRPVVLPRRIVVVGLLAIALAGVVSLAGRAPLPMLLWCAAILSPVWVLALAHVLASRRRA